MPFVLFITLASSVAGVYLYYDKQLAKVKKQLMITSNQLKKTKTQYRTLSSLSKSIQVKFIKSFITRGLQI